jgi:hypothetical protein
MANERVLSVEKAITITVNPLRQLIRVRETIEESNVLIAGLRDGDTIDCLARNVRKRQVVLDLVRLAPGQGLRAEVQGLCW